MRKLVICGMLLAVTACGPTIEQISRNEHQICEGYGFTPGTPAFSKCFMQIDQARLQQAHTTVCVYAGYGVVTCN